MVAHFSLVHSPILLLVALLGLALGFILGYFAWRYGWQPRRPAHLQTQVAAAWNRLTHPKNGRS